MKRTVNMIIIILCVLTKNSEFPDSSINIFVNVFMADKAGYILGRYGPEGSGFTMIDELVVYKTIEENGTFYNYEGPQIIIGNPLYRVEKVPDFMYDPDDIESVSGDYDRAVQRMEMVKNHPLCYGTPQSVVFPQYTPTMLSNLGDLESFMRRTIGNIIDGVISYGDALTQYRSKARQMGLQEFLDQQNQRLGVKSGQSY